MRLLLLQRLPHELQLLLTNSSHASETFVWHNQLAVAIPQLALSIEGMPQNVFTIFICRTTGPSAAC